MTLRLAGELRINPVLVFLLEREYGQRINPETLLRTHDANGDALRWTRSFRPRSGILKVKSYPYLRLVVPPLVAPYY